MPHTVTHTATPTATHNATHNATHTATHLSCHRLAIPKKQGGAFPFHSAQNNAWQFRWCIPSWWFIPNIWKETYNFLCLRFWLDDSYQTFEKRPNFFLRLRFWFDELYQIFGKRPKTFVERDLRIFCLRCWFLFQGPFRVSSHWGGLCSTFPRGCTARFWFENLKRDLEQFSWLQSRFRFAFQWPFQVSSSRERAVIVVLWQKRLTDLARIWQSGSFRKNIYTCTHIYAYMYRYMCTCIYIYTYVLCIYICVCMYIKIDRPWKDLA